LTYQGTDDDENIYRVDRIDLEPGDGLHQDQLRLPQLLRRKDGAPAEGDGAAAIQERV
jgi:hypothetical protein